MPDRNQVTIVGVDLPAFLLSKNFSFRVHRNALVGRTCDRAEKIGSGLVWWDLLTAVRSSLPAQLFWFLFFNSGFVSTNPEPRKSPQKIKNPASSAGHNRYFLAIPREAQQVLARVARKVPHSRILRLPYRSDRDSPEWPKDFGKSPNRRSVYRNSRIRQYLVKTFFHDFSSGLWIRRDTGPNSYRLYVQAELVRLNASRSKTGSVLLFGFRWQGV